MFADQYSLTDSTATNSAPWATTTGNASGAESSGGGFFSSPGNWLGQLSGLASLGLSTYERVQAVNQRNNTPEQTFDARIVPDIAGPRAYVGGLPSWIVPVGLVLAVLGIALVVKD